MEVVYVKMDRNNKKSYDKTILYLVIGLHQYTFHENEEVDLWECKWPH